MEDGQAQAPMEAPSETPAPSIDPFHPPPVPPKNRFSKKRIVVVIVGVIVLAGVGFGLAILTDNKGKKPPSSTNEQASQNTEQSDSTSDIPAVTNTKTFKTDFPRVEFTHPESWKVTENAEQEGVRIESPEFSYTSINGNTISGIFRIYIRQGARQQDSKYIGRGLAAQPSEKLTYANPSSSQRPETNLSFFGLDSSDNFAYFLIAGNFALQKDESLGPEYGTEPETYIIAGGYSSSELTDDLATNPVPVEYFSTTNAYKQAIDIIKSLKIL